jgi:hypothetical protein
MRCSGDLKNVNKSNQSSGMYSNVNWLSKLYVWSILMEPLLFFRISHQMYTGVSLTIARILQILFLIIFLTNIIIKNKNFKIEKITNNLNFGYGIFLLLSLTSVIFGITDGSYLLNSEVLNVSKDHYSVFSLTLNSSFIRPFFEFIISLYYFYYFVVLQRYMINTVNGINYFFKIFKLLFVLCLILGFVDLIFGLFGMPLITRHMMENIYVGFRFHGIAGEPRDAFVYLVFGFGIYCLNNIWLNKNMNNILLLIIVFASFMTKSTSGLFGISFAIVLVFIYYSWSKNSIYTRIIILISFSVIVSINLYYNDRIMVHLIAVDNVFKNLSANAEITGVIIGQMVNIYPIWDRWVELKNMNLVPIFFGTGYGTASVINNNLGGFSGLLLNPHAQVVRTVYETGVIGTLLFIIAFLKPIKILSNQFNTYKIISLNMLIMLGIYFSHRTSTLYIYLGFAVIIMIQKNNLMMSVHDSRD